MYKYRVSIAGYKIEDKNLQLKIVHVNSDKKYKTHEDYDGLQIKLNSEYKDQFDSLIVLSAIEVE